MIFSILFDLFDTFAPHRPYEKNLPLSRISLKNDSVWPVMYKNAEQIEQTVRICL